jgi:hypothetical protein
MKANDGLAPVAIQRPDPVEGACVGFDKLSPHHALRLSGKMCA